MTRTLWVLPFPARLQPETEMWLQAAAFPSDLRASGTRRGMWEGELFLACRTCRNAELRLSKLKRGEKEVELLTCS